MPVYDTADLTAESIARLTASAKESLYNGLDSAITFEVCDALEAQMDEYGWKQYNFSMALNAPVFEMGLRGVKIDVARKAELIPEFEAGAAQLQTNLDRLFKEGFGLSVNYRSPKQLLSFFYGVLGIKPIKKRNSKGGFSPTTDRNALEKMEHHFYARAVIKHILALRDLDKRLGFLRTPLDSDGRVRTTYNVAGTVTTRLSSRESPLETGTNLQNITKRLREIFVADAGMKFANIDLEQADSRNVGSIAWCWFNTSPYLDACESGDLHTTVSRMVWPGLAWAGELGADKDVAEQKFYRHLSYRDTSKRLGHGTNFLGQPGHMAKQTQIEEDIVSSFQQSYFKEFWDIKQWQERTIELIQANGILIDPVFQTRRIFRGRRTEPKVHREGIAHCPQLMTAREINEGIVRIWRENFCILLLQVHDSILIMYPEEQENEVVNRAAKLIAHPYILTNQRNETREFIVPTGIEVGWNFGPYNPETNPDGLIKFRGNDSRKRVRPANLTLLDARIKR